ncbi:hypothetical protein MUK42_31177 [Musa troglodytarum]|uniref:Uncharacterized protein n=1 Tax=Musa troglodytarum TaxID=320322 RepID=A0A9E7GLP8_9LILI|nr:hypothetical protein MUK42_31177 [Musa troglodytarum]
MDGGVQSQRAPACLSSGTREPLMWHDITFSTPPRSCPPTKTAGTAAAETEGEVAERRWERTAWISRPPLPSWSSSYTVGPTPSPSNRRFTTWHMQQPLTLNTTTAFPLAILATLSDGPLRLIIVIIIPSAASSTILIRNLLLLLLLPPPPPPARIDSSEHERENWAEGGVELGRGVLLQV